MVTFALSQGKVSHVKEKLVKGSISTFNNRLQFTVMPAWVALESSLQATSFLPTGMKILLAIVTLTLSLSDFQMRCTSRNCLCASEKVLTFPL